jgi:beta-glucosidase
VIEPDGLYEILTRLSHEAPALPLYITENGCAADDYVNPDGEVNDFERVDYIYGHLEAAWRAIQDGVNLAGYFHWSLMDNFEWAWGYQRRFGLFHVDFGTQRRTAKRSAGFYADIVETGELPDRPPSLSARFLTASGDNSSGMNGLSGLGGDEQLVESGADAVT